MDQTVALVLLGLFLIGLVSAAFELYGSMQPVRCPQCEHCKAEIAAERSARERAWREFRRDNEPHERDNLKRR